MEKKRKTRNAQKILKNKMRTSVKKVGNKPVLRRKVLRQASKNLKSYTVFPRY
jgi:hypothetical protein